MNRFDGLVFMQILHWFRVFIDFMLDYLVLFTYNFLGLLIFFYIFSNDKLKSSLDLFT